MQGLMAAARVAAMAVAMAAAMAVGAQVSVPLGEVPFTLQSFCVLLAGFTLGSARGVLAVALYLAAGSLGLPVFAGGASGAGRLIGPTGGFLIAFLPMAALAGVAARDRARPPAWGPGLLWGALATAATLALGLPWLALARGLPLSAVLATGLSLLPGAAIKLLLAVLVRRRTGSWRPGAAGAQLSSP